MGSGKGSPEYWVAVVKPGKILYEISGVSGNIAKAAMKIAAYKMPIRTQFITTNEKHWKIWKNVYSTFYPFSPFDIKYQNFPEREGYKQKNDSTSNLFKCCR